MVYNGWPRAVVNTGHYFNKHKNMDIGNLILGCILGFTVYYCLDFLVQKSAVNQQHKNMETTIEQDMEGLNKPKEPVNYALKYGQLRGLIIALEPCADSSEDRLLRRMVLNAVKRMEEIDRE